MPMITGQFGDDFLNGTSESDSLFGLEGNDVLLGREGNDLANGNQDNDQINGNEGDDTVRGGQENDLVRGGKNNDEVFGDKGNDILWGDLGNDSVYGGTGSDFPIGEFGDRDLIYGNFGTDLLFGNQGNDTIYSGQDSDRSYGGKDDDLVFGNEGADTVFGDLGNDIVLGGNGSEIAVGREIERDLVFGNQGNDIVFGNEGDDTVRGGSDNDLAFGGKDDDLVFGDQGADTVFGDLGNDTVFGGNGSDNPVGTAIERDLVFGNVGNDLVFGNEGDDTVYAGQNNDIAYGGKDNDIVYGDRGDDTVFGDLGDDTLFGGVSDPDLGDAAGRDLIRGGQGNDFINGNENNDTLFGEDGCDIVRGGKGNDIIFGNECNDALFGDLGADTLTGGTGGDVFIIGVTTGGPALTDADWILDFGTGTDFIGLTEGQTFANLNIFQGVAENAPHTIIQDRTTGQYLAILVGVNAATLTQNQFTTNLIPECDCDDPSPSPTPTPVPVPTPTPVPVPTPTPVPVPTPTPVPVPTPTPIPVPTPIPTDATVTLAVAPASIPEDSGAGLVYIFTRTDSTNAPLSSPLTVNFTVAGSATLTGDYTQTGAGTFNATTGTVTFAPGSNTATIVVSPVADPTIEPDETVQLTLGPGTGYIIGTPGAIAGTITNDDGPTTYNFTNDTFSTVEGDTTNTTNVVTIVRTGNISTAESVDVVLTADTATAGTDFTSGPITITFAAGQTTAQVPIELLGETAVEPNETINLSLTNFTGTGVVGTTNPTAIFTITNDDGPPTYDFVAATFTTLEGDTTNTTNIVTIIRTGDTSSAESVDVVLTADTATAGTDFTSGPITINFAAGQTTAQVPIELLGETTVEPNETINLSLTNFSGSGQIGTTNPTATLTITNDDGPPTYDFSTASFSTLEGDTTNTTNVVTIVRTGDTSTAESVDVVLTGGTATVGTDFTTGPITINFAAGQASAQVPIEILGDLSVEPNETINLSLTNFSGSGQIGTTNPTATLTITNDDGPPTYDFVAATFTTLEGDTTNTTNVVTIVRSGDTSSPESVDVVLTAGSATAGTDFTSGPITINFAAGQTTAQVPIELLGETTVEPNETINLSLTNFSGSGQIGTTNPTATLTITNDDGPPTYDFSTASFSTLEGDTTNTTNVVTIVRTGDTSTAESVDVVLTGGTATAGTDFTSGPITINFAAGQTTAQVPIEILGDLSVEPNETINLSLTNFSGSGQIGTTNPTATLTITNDDGPPTYDFSTASFSTLEGDTTNTTNVVTIVRTGDTSTAESVDVVLTGGTATVGTDFTSGPITINFAAGQTTAQVPIELLGETTVEPNETINLSLTNFSGSGQIGTTNPTATLTITNDDGPPTYDFSTASFSTLEGDTTNTTNVVTIVRTGDTSTAESVDVVLTADTATAGTDFTSGPITINFAAGQTTAQVPIELLGETTVEPNETINLSLTNFSGSGQIGTTNPTATLTITNDDGPPTYDFSTASFSTLEGDTTNITNVVTIVRTGDTSTAESVDVVLTGGTATAGTDFTAGPITVSFAAGQASAQVPIELLGDLAVESNETLNLSLTNFTGSGQIGTTNPTATLTITNDDGPPIYDFTNATYTTTEGDTTNTTNVVTIVRSGDTSTAESVDVVLTNGSAAAGTDFTAGPITVSFAAGQASAQVPIELLGDLAVEPNETLNLSLTNFTGSGQIGTTNPTATLTITNDDGPPIYDFANASFTATEGDTTNTTNIVTIIRTGDTSSAESVDVVLANGTATAGSDFTAGPITVSFAAGQASAQVPIEVLGDLAVELDETLNLSLTNFTGTGVVGTTNPTATLTITNDDGPPTYDFVAATFNALEGDTTNITNVVSIVRTGDTSSAESVDVVLTNGTATAGTDFTAGPITVNFAAGQTTAQVPIQLLGETAIELNEILNLSLNNFTGTGVVGTTNPTATLTITNDDGPPIYDFANASFTTTEGDITNTTNVVTIVRSGDTSTAESVDVVLTNGSAAAGTDFTAGPITVSFAAGQASAQVPIELLGDLAVEPNETLNLSLTNFTGSGQIGTTNPTATLTITNDDGSPIYDFANASFTTTEGDITNTTNVVTIVRSGDTSTAESVDVVLANGTATAGSDFTAGPITVSFAAGQASAQVPIELLGDLAVEPNETLNLSLTNFTGTGVVGTTNPTATLTITNDDGPPTYDFVAATFNALEGDTTNITNVVSIVRTGDTSSAESVDVVLTNGTATAGTDFTAGPITVNFAAGQTTAQVPIQLLGETTPELDETINLSLTNFTGTGVAGTTNPTATLTITNDDGPPTYDFVAATFNALEGDTTNITNVVSIVRTGDTSSAESVDVVLTNGTATAGTDFTAGPITVNFAAGQTTAQVPIQLLGETTPELDETINLSLTNFTGTGVAGTTNPTAILTITDDDSPPTYDFNLANFNSLEGDTTNTTNVVQITRTGDISNAESVTVGLAAGTATVGNDFTAGPVVVNFAAGQNTATVPIELLGDIVFEPNETINLSFTAFSGNGQAGTTNPTSTLTIVNDERIYDFSAPTYTTVEGDVTNTPANLVTLNRQGNLIAEDVQVLLIASGANPAIPGSDFTAGPITVSFAAGQASADVPIELLGDTVFEFDETLDFALTGFTAGGTPGTTNPTATLTITNDDPPVAVDDNVIIVEGATFPIPILDDDRPANLGGIQLDTFDPASIGAIAVTLDDNGTAADPSDDLLQYTAPAAGALPGDADSFTYTVADQATGTLQSTPATVSLTIVDDTGGFPATTITGTGSRDIIVGGDNFDEISGGGGDDVIYGGGDGDDLTGGGGQDEFWYLALSDSDGSGGSGFGDAISDFNVSEDIIRLRLPGTTTATPVAANIAVTDLGGNFYAVRLSAAIDPAQTFEIFLANPVGVGVGTFEADIESAIAFGYP